MFSDVGSPGEDDVYITAEGRRTEHEIDGMYVVANLMQAFRDTHPDLVEGIEYVLFGTTFTFDDVREGLQKKEGSVVQAFGNLEQANEICLQDGKAARAEYLHHNIST